MTVVTKTYHTQADWQAGSFTDINTTRVPGSIYIDVTGIDAQQTSGWVPECLSGPGSWTRQTPINGNNGAWSTPGNTSMAWEWAGPATNHEGFAYQNISSAQGRWATDVNFLVSSGPGGTATIWFHFMFNQAESPLIYNDSQNFWQGYAVKLTWTNTTGSNTNTLAIVRVDTDSTSETVLASTLVAGTASSDTHNLRVDRDAVGDMNVYYDGVLKLSVTDNTYTSGTKMGWHVHSSSTGNVITVLGANYPTDSFIPTTSLTSTWTSTIPLDVTTTPNAWTNISSTLSTSGATIILKTASSPNNSSYSPFVAATGNSVVQSPLNRYLNIQVVMNTTLNSTEDPSVSLLTIGGQFGTQVDAFSSFLIF